VRSAIGFLLAGCLLFACAEEPAPVPQTGGTLSPWEALWVEGGRIDTVGVVHIAEGDTASGHPGLTAIERTVTFGGEGEVVAWEFFARELQPVKLIVVRYAEEREYFELVGESETVIPRQKGLNRFILREPIPVGFRYMFGIVMPKEESVPFKKVTSWKTMITTRPLERLRMRRDSFVTYGWRYSVRVFWRPSEEEGS
jgi:hypothetical protein